MSDDPNAAIELYVEIIRERPQALGIMVSPTGSPAGFHLVGVPTRLIWLPRAEIVKLTRADDGQAVIAIPRWLAENEGLIDAVEAVDPNQGMLL